MQKYQSEFNQKKLLISSCYIRGISVKKRESLEKEKLNKLDLAVYDWELAIAGKRNYWKVEAKREIQHAWDPQAMLT